MGCDVTEVTGCRNGLSRVGPVIVANKDGRDRRGVMDLGELITNRLFDRRSVLRIGHTVLASGANDWL